jgi:hypothetical protein
LSFFISTLKLVYNRRRSDIIRILDNRRLYMSEEVRGIREIEDWLSPSEAGKLLGTSGQWVTQLARTGRLDGVRTSLGWLVNPKDVDRVAAERTEAAEKKLSAMKDARSRVALRTRGNIRMRGGVNG